MASISEAARRTGVPAATLRIWERRYGVPSPERTESGYRTYGPQDLAAIVRMRDLVALGMGPAEAAAELVLGPTSGPDPERFVADLLGPDGGADVDRELAARLRTGDLEEVADTWLLPMLAEVGRRWEAGDLGIGIEHALTAAVQRRLAVLWNELPEGTRTPTVLVGLPAGARHDITLFCFAVLLRREGFRVGYLGADLPASSWADAVAGDLPCVVVTALHSETDLAATEALVSAVRNVGAGLVAVGGGDQGRVRSPVVRLGHVFSGALERLTTMV